MPGEMVTPESLTEEKAILEQKELNGKDDCILGADAYVRLLSIYIYFNEMVNAKYLWKRIPREMKEANPEISRLWMVGQALWNRNLSNALKAIESSNWSEHIQHVMISMKDKLRNEFLKLIARAYTSIHIKDLAERLYSTPEETEAIVVERGWKIDSSTKMVEPCAPVIPDGEEYASLETPAGVDLASLTRLVSYLEN